VAAEWAASDNNRKAKYYRLRAAGRKQLEAELSNWARVSSAVSLILESAQETAMWLDWFRRRRYERELDDKLRFDLAQAGIGGSRRRRALNGGGKLH